MQGRFFSQEAKEEDCQSIFIITVFLAYTANYLEYKELNRYLLEMIGRKRREKEGRKEETKEERQGGRHQGEQADEEELTY